MSTTEVTRDKRTSAPLHITGVELNENNGWYRITTDGVPKEGFQTRKQDIAEIAVAFKQSGALIAVSYTHVEKPNTNSDWPKTYVDDYFDSAEVVEEAKPADDGITRVRPSAPEKTPQEAWRIALAVGSERAVQSLPYLEDKEFASQWALAYEWAQHIFLTPPPTELRPSAAPGGRASAPGAYDEPPPHADDDIPF